MFEWGNMASFAYLSAVVLAKNDSRQLRSNQSMVSFCHALCRTKAPTSQLTANYPSWWKLSRERNTDLWITLWSRERSLEFTVDMFGNGWKQQWNVEYWKAHGKDVPVIMECLSANGDVNLGGIRIVVRWLRCRLRGPYTASLEPFWRNWIRLKV
jgi:hypothetical protein